MRPLTIIAVLLSLLAGIGALATRELSSATSPDDHKHTKTIRSTTLTSGADGVTFTPKQDGYLIISNLSDQKLTASITVSTASVDVASEIHWNQLKPLSGTNLQAQPRVSSSDRQPESLRTANKEQRERTFFIHVSSSSLNDPRGYQLLNADLLLEGDQVRVFLDRNCENTEKQMLSARKIIHALDDTIIPSATALSGSFADVDQDGKLAVLLTPCLDQMQGGKTSLKGFVRASDFCKHYPRPYSNRTDLIYLNSECAPDTNYLTLLAHEYWHVMQFSHRLAQPGARKELQEDWICEGSAHLAEHRFGGDGSNLKHRVSAWMRSPEQSPLIVPDYYSAGLWRHDGCRGGLFLFFRWCENQYGPTFMIELLKTTGTGSDALEQVTGESFETLHQHSLISILKESLLSSRTPKTQNILNEELFEEVTLEQLKVHDVTTSSPYQLKLEATASTYLKVTKGEIFRIQSEQGIPLRLLFVPIEALSSDRVDVRAEKQITR
ncbi:MAG: hypothetical protein P8M30_07670 [Planctomycetaceae bacterium]|jgi:hypothetical protein|nr:hypothetical protein [bacterium]MDB4786815.1 hypothetical protein [Planctomycetaceae bacterium]MDC0273103.1 hypothetical protein [Planctomycetaceae bacterium]MDG2389183.1 hypothetical protein [Planctomycetaceae bacterium]